MIMTKTSRLVRFLIQTLLLPVNVDQDGKVMCKILSWRTALHLFIVVAPTTILFVALMLIVPELSMISIDIHQSSHEIISKNINFIVSNLSIIFPFLLAYGLNNMPSNSLSISQHAWPNGGWKNILGIRN